MQPVRISPKFQVVILKKIRESLQVTPGQKMQAILFEDRIEPIPIGPVKRVRGFLEGIDTTIVLQKDRV